MASMTSARWPSLKLGTHSTSTPEAEAEGRSSPLMVPATILGALNHSGSRSILDLSVREFLEVLGSAEPAPGGGAAAALAGALSAALVEMTAHLTLGRQRYADVQEQAQTIADQCGRLRQTFQRLCDADTAAFASVSKAYTMP